MDPEINIDSETADSDQNVSPNIDQSETVSLHRTSILISVCDE